MQDIYQVLNQLNIPYGKHDHPPVFTVEEAQKYDRGIDAGKNKNLFLRNKKGDKHYLVVIDSTKRLDLKELSSRLDESKISFASPERLLEYLGLTPGSVSPFGLINDKNKSVNVIIDNDLMKNKKLAFHPNINTSTLVISTTDFQKFLAWTGNNLKFTNL